MQAGIATNTPFDDAIARLIRQYKAEGDLELMFIRQIAGAQVTYESLQRAIDTLLAAADLNDARIDRLSRAKAREQRVLTSALKELKDLQQRRNAIERFPTQTTEFPPLADHTDFIGLPCKIKPLLGLRKRNYPDPAKIDALLKDINHPNFQP